LIEHKPDAPNGNHAVSQTGGDANQDFQAPWMPQQTFRGVLLTLIPWIVFSLALTAVGGSSSTQSVTATQDLVGGIVAFIFTALIEGVFVLAPLHYAKVALQASHRLSRAVFAALGLRKFQVRPALLWIVGLLVLIIAFDQLYSFAIALFHLNIQTNDQQVLREGATQPLTVYGLLIGSVFIAPLCEELFFRGFVLSGLLRELSPFWAIVISAALFAIAHLDPGSFIPLFVIGLALGVLRWRTRSTWPGITLHMLNNGLSSIIIVLALHHITIPGLS
jgi:membrane protease YdiL (CAAX protease family)